MGPRRRRGACAVSGNAMRSLTNALPAQIKRGHLLGIGFFVFALLLAYKLSDYIIANDVSSLALAGLAFLACAIVVAILNNWRHGVYFFLTWLLFEDLARKYLGNNM